MKYTAFLIAVFSICTFLYCTDYYVSPDGIDNVHYGSQFNPWQTIQYAVDQVALLQPLDGGRIFVQEGTYHESIVILTSVEIIGNGAPEDCIIMGVSPYYVVSAGQLGIAQCEVSIRNVTIINGQFFTAPVTPATICIQASNLTNSVIQGCVFDLCQLPLNISDSSNLTIRNNQFRNIWKDANGNISLVNVDRSFNLKIENNNLTPESIMSYDTIPAHTLKGIKSTNSQIHVSNNQFQWLAFPPSMLLIAIVCEKDSYDNLGYGELMNTISSNSFRLLSCTNGGVISLKDVSVNIFDNSIIGQIPYLEGSSVGLEINNQYEFLRPSITFTNNLINGFDYGVQVGTGDNTLNVSLLFSMKNNTIVNCNRACFIATIAEDSELHFTNNILYCASSIYSLTPLLDVDCDYSLLTVCTGMSFLPENTHNVFGQEPGFTDGTGILPASYYLNSHSPCIDAGDPDTNRDGNDYTVDQEDRDPDHSRIDMGCFAFTHDYESKYFHDGWNWVCFPKLRGISGKEETAEVLGDPANSYYPLLDGFVEIDYNDLPYQYNLISQIWYGADDVKSLHSINGYKVAVDNPGIVQTFKNYGNRIVPNTAMSLYTGVIAPTGNWVGYYQPKSMNIVDAFGSDFSKIESIKAEDWYYVSWQEDPRTLPDPVPDIFSTAGKVLEYGKSYVVTVREDVPGFYWRSEPAASKPEILKKPQHFTYTDKADYETIELIGMPSKEDFAEIGVYENDVCVGAAVIDSLPLQIRAYTEEIRKSEAELTVRLYSPGTGEKKVQYLMVWDKALQCFGTMPLLSGHQDYSIIRLGVDPGQDAALPRISQNYPNPFNRVTAFSCYVPKNSVTRLCIYNLRGQKVKTILNEKKEAGIYHLTWDGKNEAGKEVSSGIYLYRLDTCSKHVTNKMLLVK